MGKQKNQANSLIAEARCQGDMTTISLDEVRTVTLCFVVFISVQLKEPLIQSLKSGRSGRSPYPTALKIIKIHLTIFLGYKNPFSSFSEDSLRIGAL